ncbi:type I-F CRISPR-associated endoribonuclease Cas6/Csy4 [Uruburuella testudinis]|uniref:Type I-F CRISPR-associated endoribonuclease Cas6/Csy4 n=1 Tax=Uruburuella testudinis TaxID=1282863 RepID=A0ABY4DU36_9NEIS|nr:type I-F CRISPR-associated endoribonuclease Cas6/Csy4 [Uruburuella testudinis]UOO82561.1 type I-F CRISPR-associated endoribonuclease Cas6/Csy4 [Uruburuella testudinis]
MNLSHYIELKAIPQADMMQAEVISHLMQQIHRRLPTYAGRIGTAFPGYSQQRTLGGIIRLFGSRADIQQLHDALQTLADYALIDAPAAVPSTHRHAVFARWQPKGQSDRRRAESRLKAQGLSDSEICQRLYNKQLKQTDLRIPFVQMYSSSTGQHFPLWITCRSKSQMQTGLFNSYGLSHTTTVPAF